MLSLDGCAGRILMLVASVALAWLLFAPALDGPIVRDDLMWFGLVYPSGSFDGGAVAKLVWPDDPAYTYNNHLRPVGWLSIAADDRLVGNRVQDFRAVAITIHGIIGWVVGLLALRLGARGTGAFVAAALFVAYGSTHEPVVLVQHRFTLLSTLFFGCTVVAAHRHARGEGRLVMVAVWALLAILSKDSMLSILFAAALIAFAAAPAGARWRTGFLVGAMIGAIAALDLCLRKLSTGAWIPALQGGTDDVVSGMDSTAIVDALPRFLRVLAAPVAVKPHDGDVWPVLRVIAIIATCLATAWSLSVTLRRPRERGAGLALLVGILLLSFPVLHVADNLESARNLYPVVLALAPWLAATWGRRAPVLLVLVALNVPMLLKNQRMYMDLGPVFEDAVARTEAMAATGLPVTVMGLPQSVNGTPACSTAPNHFHLRFYPPLHPERRAVRGLAPGETPGPPVEGEPWAILALDAAEDGTLTSAWTARVPSDSESAASRGLRLRRPATDQPWPASGAATVVVAPDPGNEVPADAILRIRIQYAQQQATWFVRADGPGVARTPTAISIDLMSTASLAPLPGVAALRAAAATGIPATIAVDVLPPPGASAGAGTGSVSFGLRQG